MVFVIDDDPGVRAATQSLLRSVGLKVEAFSSATEFLINKIPDAPSCLVLDVRLPGAAGSISRLNWQKPIFKFRSFS